MVAASEPMDQAPPTSTPTSTPTSLATPTIETEFEQHRKELTGYCYRMLGSGFEAEDAVQETMVRAWKGAERFEGRSSVRSWLYRIATNVCLDMLRGPQRRARPMDLGPSSTADTRLGAPLAEGVWIQPIADARVVPDHGDPADVAAARDSIRLAFVAALQHLPPRQRAVIILFDVLRMHADEVAELLDSSVASVNSALQRARASLAPLALDTISADDLEAEHAALLERYVDAFERYDIPALVSLVHEDATFSMPPFDLWLEGPEEMAAWYHGQGAGCRGSKLLSTRANGQAAYAAYKPAGPGLWKPFALQVIEVGGGRIVALNHFLDPALFAAFGFPDELTER